MWKLFHKLFGWDYVLVIWYREPTIVRVKRVPSKTGHYGNLNNRWFRIYGTGEVEKCSHWEAEITPLTPLDPKPLPRQQ